MLSNNSSTMMLQITNHKSNSTSDFFRSRVQNLRFITSRNDSKIEYMIKG